MNSTPKEEIDGFLNALQLSINPVLTGGHVHKGLFITEFAKDSRQDPNCKFFTKLVNGFWSEDGRHLKFMLKDENHLKTLWTVLMLTRLDMNNMKSLAHSDKNFSWLNPFLTSSKSSGTLILNDIPHAARALFEEVNKKNMTTRELSQLTGISQVSLFRFKQGKDIRLSSFLEIVHALKFDICLKPRK